MIQLITITKNKNLNNWVTDNSSTRANPIEVIQRAAVKRTKNAGSSLAYWFLE